MGSLSSRPAVPSPLNTPHFHQHSYCRPPNARPVGPESRLLTQHSSWKCLLGFPATPPPTRCQNPDSLSHPVTRSKGMNLFIIASMKMEELAGINFTVRRKLYTVDLTVQIHKFHIMKIYRLGFCCLFLIVYYPQEELVKTHRQHQPAPNMASASLA